VRVVSRYAHPNQLSGRPRCIFKQKILDLLPPHPVVHGLHQPPQLLALQPHHPHNTVHQRGRIAPLVEDALVDQLSDLSEEDWVVQLVVDLEEEVETVEWEDVLRVQAAPLAQRQGRFHLLLYLLC
jgi:hypothetical protein